MNLELAAAADRRQDRHAVAALSAALSLRTRLSLLVGFIVALVVGTAAFLELRMFTTPMERDLIGGARNTARAVADDVELRAKSDDPEVESGVLHEFLEVSPALQAITLIKADGTFLSTSTNERQAALALARRAITEGDEVDEVAGLLRFVAVPFAGPRGPMSVVVTVSTATVDRVARDGGLLALYVMLPAIVIVTVLLDWLARRLVHRRLNGIRQTMRLVASGDLRARAVIERPDEIGAIVTGLNSMLAEMEGWSDSLQMRVREATAELRARNVEVEEMYQRVFDLREALAKAEQLAAVGQAAANVAHQVGTPLNLVSGYVQVLLSDPSLDTRTRRRLEMMQRQIEQVTSAVRGLLDRARRTVLSAQVDPAALIERVLEIAQPRLDRNHVAVEVRAHAGLPRIEADAVQLELALLNLITNAIDAMVEGGALTVSLEQSGDGIRLEVADSGPGVPEALLPTIFEPWVTTKAFGRGTGLGLAIARDVIGAHGGTISVSNRPAGGALFTVQLPAVHPPSIGPDAAPPLAAPHAGRP